MIASPAAGPTPGGASAAWSRAGVARVRRRKATSQIMLALSAAAAALAVVPLVWILAFVVLNGLPAISLDFFTNAPTPVGVPGGGIGNAIIGSAITVGLGAAIAAPIGILAAIYVAARRQGLVTTAIRFATDTLAGVPSIVMGVFAYSIVVLPQRHFSALAGGVVLAFIMLPIIIRSTEEMLKLVPGSLREASLALGAAEWRTTLRVLLPAAGSGILTGLMLAIARAAGEAAPMLFTAFGNPFFSTDLEQPIATLPHTIYVYAISPYEDWKAKAWATALVLIALVLVLNIAARGLTGWRARRLRTATRWPPSRIEMIVTEPSQPDLTTLQAVAGPVPAPSTGGARQDQATSEPKIRIRGLTIHYGTFRAIRDITFDVAPNEVTAIIGPSGCGKTTLLRSLNRMTDLVPTAKVGGEALLDGENILGPDVDVVEVRRRVGMVFQRPNPFPKSIYDNVAYGPRLYGVRGRDLDEVVERTLRAAALWDEVRDKLRGSAMALSGGQQQRLCIARAMAVNPEVILMDEPASALDPIATQRIEELIAELRKAYTIVIVTHNMQQASRVSDRTAFLTMGEDRAGYLVEMDDTVRIFTNPRERLTEDYISGRFG